MKITAVHVDTLELAMEEPGLKQEVVDGVSWIDVPDGPGLGIELIEEHVGPQRVARRW